MNNVPPVAADLSKVLNGFNNTVEYQICGHVKTFRTPIKDVADLRNRTIDHLRHCLNIKGLLAQSQTGVVSVALSLPEDFVDIYSVEPESATSENSKLKREMVAPPGHLANDDWRNDYMTMLKLPVPVGAAVGGGAHAQEHADDTDSDDEDPLSTDNEEEHDEEGNDEDDDGEPLTSDDDFSWDAVDFDNIPNADQKLVKAAAFMICKAHKMI